MIRTKAPLRINFGGGGTDVEPYASDYGGNILSASINMYARAIYGIEHSPENEWERLLSDISHNDIMVTSDIFSASGLGGSSACLVAGLKAMYPVLDKEQIATLAFYLERNVLRFVGGIQDQYCAAYGGFLYLTIDGKKTYIENLKWPKELSTLLLLVYTGKRKVASEKIIADQIAHIDFRALHHQKQIAISMKECIRQLDLIGFGKLIGEAWEIKKEMSSLVTTSELDSLYTYCCNNGAIGGCIMGAGSGGYMLFMEYPEKEGMLRQALLQKNIQYINIDLDMEGVRVI